ncbi:hypothetical protein [Bacillus mesophilum]|uniref:Uncharacterized protein n=1 Tax=Bacillus mesophilum TaxID=1071718 RepID=A0A7V7UT43_9BACI|nr:hypothetical protein [Bacillus mesophilum]KAB2329472.1 hypothetical protein F7732_21340 [Bacillus mesophilum]
MDLKEILHIAEHVLPFIIPFISVYCAFFITKKHNERQNLKNEKTQRIKLLTLLRKEAEMFKDYRYQKNTHRSKEFVTIKLILTSPAFNVSDHGKIIELALEMERINQNIDISINAMSGVISTSIGGYLSKLSSGSPVLGLMNSGIMKFFTGKRHVDRYTEAMNKLVEQNIKDSTKDSLPVIDEIIREVDRLLLIEVTPKKFKNRA